MTILKFVSVSLIIFLLAGGAGSSTWNVCSQATVDGYNTNGGYVQSNGYSGSYSYNENCQFQVNVQHTKFHYIAFRVLDWNLDRSGYGDRLTMYRYTNGRWYWVKDMYYHTSSSFLNNYRSVGHVKFQWYSDGSRAWYFSGSARWKIAWTFQEYVFGCELHPQPYIFGNTTKHGVLQSPYFPDRYPTNSYCQVIIDVDQSVDSIEFVTNMFQLISGDYLKFYVGDAQLNNWAQYASFTSKPATFILSGVDVKILFTSDYYKCGYGYQMYWRIISKEHYSLYRPESLLGFWPMTAAHRGRDIINDCDASSYPTTGSITPMPGPTGQPGTALYFDNAYLNMTSTQCAASTLLTGSLTISVLAQTAVQTAIVEFVQDDGSGTSSTHLWHYGGNGIAWFNPTGQLSVNSATHSCNLDKRWKHIAVTHNHNSGKAEMYIDGVHKTTATNAVGSVPISSGGFLVGYRDSRVASGGIAQIGRFSCLSIYSEAMTSAEIAQLKILCEKIHAQYEIASISTLVGWWPLIKDGSSSTVMRDVSGNGRHGVYQTTTGITATDGPSGLTDSAINFDGGASSHAIVTNFPYSTMGKKSITISAFVRHTGGGAMSIVDHYRDASTRGFAFNFYPAGTDLHTNANVGTGAYPSITTNGHSWAYWTFVSTSYESWTGELKQFVNATEISSSNIGVNAAIGLSDYGFYVGRTVVTDNYRYSGKMACLSMYMTALTAEQLAKVMAACQLDNSHPPIHAELVGFWPLTNLTELLDISGNEHHGVASSGTVALATGPFGVPNTAYTIGEDSNSYITFPGGAGTDLGTGSWTISCYIKTKTSAGGPLVEYLNSSTPSAPDSVGLHIWVYSSTIYYNNYHTSPSVSGFNWGQWQFITVTYDAEQNKMFIYRDGASLGSWTTTGKVSSTHGFNIGFRALDGVYLQADIACLSMYRVAFSNADVFRVIKMCQSYLMDQELRNVTKAAETDCNFDNGFCGWHQALADSPANWELHHDTTPTGQPGVFTTGPRFGKSAERVDALDQYALLNAASAGLNTIAKLLSPGINEGWHCFEFWYYMGGKDVDELSVEIYGVGTTIFKRTGDKFKQWRFAAVPFFMSEPGMLAIKGKAGTTVYSDIAIDSVRVTDGQCVSRSPCPRGWIDFGNKCYFDLTTNFANYALSWSDLEGNMCNTRLKARIARPDNAEELAFLQSRIGGSTIWLDGKLSGGQWKTFNNYPLFYLPWAGGEPAGSNSYLGLTSSGFVALSGGSYGGYCEVYKVEAQHLGFNCSFDNKHLCGWTNGGSDSTDLASNGGASIDVDVWGGMGLPWPSNEDYENGPERDWNHGNFRGYYMMLQDSIVPSCSSLYTFVKSPLTKGTNKPQCLRFRTVRTKYVDKIEAFLHEISGPGHSKSVANSWYLTGDTGIYWRTFELEYRTAKDYMIELRFWLSCDGGFGNHAVDNIELFDSTCNMVNYNDRQTSVYDSNRPKPGWEDSNDAITDHNFVTCGTSYPWRKKHGGNTNWVCESWQTLTFRRTGPQSDYTGNGNFLNLDTSSGGSLKGSALWSGPPIPSGQHCFIFHYYQHGYDVGEIRLKDSNGRYYWARQRPQSPAWKEHRILMNSLEPTRMVFEGSSGFHDGNTHFYMWKSIQLDDIYVRNGTDLCLGYMDCDFDKSSYLLDCGWQQNDTDDSDWIRNSGETPAGNAKTGPSADDTTGLGHYLYFDATNLHPGAKARIHMPPISAGKSCLTFKYHMWGQDMGSLRVFYQPQDNLKNSNGNFPPYTETTIWKRKGQQGNFWVRAMVPVDLSYPQILTFEAMRGNGDRGDIALDDVVVLRGDCPNDHSLSCSFERGDACVWHNDATAQQNFVVKKGKTAATPIGGPEGDATGLYAGGFYALMSASTSSVDDAARLVSPEIPADSTVCFKAAYNMRGRQHGRLNILRNSEVVYRLRGGNTGYEWRQILLTISSAAAFKIKIEAIRGSSQYGDIAIDDISVTDGPCPGQGDHKKPLQTIDARNGYMLVGHEMLSTAAGASDLASCVTLCEGTPDCRSVNYNTRELTCQLNRVIADQDPANYKVDTTGDITHAWVVPAFAQMDIRLRSLCSLDSNTCTVSTNCNESLTNSMFTCKCVEPGSSCYIPRDCSDAFNNGYLASGAYLIMPTAGVAPAIAWCEMDFAAQKGYTVLANRNSGGTRFHGKSLAEYESFFGSVNHEYWLGLTTMHQLTNERNYGYIFEGSLSGTSYTPINGMTTPIVVAAKTDNYRITLEQSGNMTTLMAGMPFSTFDNDLSGVNECLVGGGGWWYTTNGTCLHGTLTAAYRPGEDLSATKAGMYSLNLGSTTGLSTMKLKVTRI